MNKKNKQMLIVGLVAFVVVVGVATFVFLLLLAPLGMSIEHNDDFRRRDKKRSKLSKTVFEN